MHKWDLPEDDPIKSNLWASTGRINKRKKLHSGETPTGETEQAKVTKRMENACATTKKTGRLRPRRFKSSRDVNGAGRSARVKCNRRARANQQHMNADNGKKSSRIKRGKGLRVHLYPTPRQQRLLLPMMHARHVIRNWAYDIFNRSAARAAGDEGGANELAIDCTESAAGAAVRDLRRLPGYKWLQTTPLWSALQVVKDCFKAREQAFELKRPMPKGKRKPPNGEGSVAFPYDGRAHIAKRQRTCTPPHGTARANAQIEVLEGQAPARVNRGTGHSTNELVDRTKIRRRLDWRYDWTHIRRDRSRPPDEAAREMAHTR